MKNKYLSFIFILLAILNFSCRDEKIERRIIASAYDYNLYFDELQKQIPSSLKDEDSALFVQNYINRWMQEKAILHFSVQNMGDDEQSIEDKIEKYRNSLIIYNYQKRLIQQNLDTIVSETEIEEYYQSHQNDFELKDNIVKVVFIKLDKNSQNLKEAKNLLKNYNPEDKKKLQDLADRYAVNYFINDDVWLLFDDLIKEVPIQTYNAESFIQNNKFIEITDSLYTTIALINGFRTKESISPLSFESDRIRMIILNKRKQMLLRKLEEDIIEKARNEGALIIHNN